MLRDDKTWVYIDKDGNFVKENENDEEKVNFFDYFFEDGGERIYAMYDYDKEEDCFQRDVIIDLEDRDEDLIEEIIEIVAETLEVEADTVDPGCDLMEVLGADSIDIIEIIAELEDRKEIFIPEDEIPELRSVKDIAAFVEAAIARKE